MAGPDGPNTLFYDGACPVCGAYARHVRLRDSLGDLQLVDLRQRPDLVVQFRAFGLEPNAGMVLKLGTRVYHGADCLHAVALMSTGAGWFNRANAALFRSERLSRWAYPILVRGRSVLLRLLNRPPLS